MAKPTRKPANRLEFANLMRCSRQDVQTLIEQKILTPGATGGQWLVEFGRFMFEHAKDWWRPAKQEEFARRLDVSQPTVAKLLSRGVLSRGAPAGQWLIEYGKHMQQMAAGWQSEDGAFDLIAEKARLAARQAEAIEIEIAKKRREVLPVAPIAAGLTVVNAIIRSKLLALPSRLKSLLPQLTPSDVNTIDELLREALTELGQMRLPEEVVQKLHELEQSEWERIQQGQQTKQAESRLSKKRSTETSLDL